MNSTDGDTGDASHGEETDDTGDYMIDEAFNGTTWQSGELTMHIVWQDGYYKAVVMENLHLLFHCGIRDVNTTSYNSSLEALSKFLRGTAIRGIRCV